MARRRLDPNPTTAPASPVAAPDVARPSLAGAALRPMPIATVAGDSATQAALDEMSGELIRARAEGRLLLRLPLDAVDETYLVRDRLAPDPEEMAVLEASIRARGQQAPIEVAELGGGRYGLISGWRRLVVLRQIAATGGEGTVLAMLRRPDMAAGAYLAMVEENEIRAGLSFYERARVVVRAADNGVFPDDRAALAHLFAAVPRSRRSKIGSFTRLVRAFERPEALHQGLFFPTHLSEKQGLALVAVIDRDPAFADRLALALAADPPVAPVVEATRIADLLRPSPDQRPAPTAPITALPPSEIDLRVLGEGEILLSGPGVADPAFRRALDRFLASRR
jgi:ParB family chromosome partitioning protein